MTEDKINHNDLYLRKAELNDAELIYDLSIDPLVRENSFDKSTFTFDDHIKWYNQKITSKDFLLLLAFVQNEFAGQVKFSIEDNIATIGISVSKPFRGRGVAKPLITKGIHYLKKEMPTLQKVFAFIKKENAPSTKLFEKCSFVFDSMENIKKIEANKYIYHI